MNQATVERKPARLESGPHTPCQDVLACMDSPAFREEMQKRLSVANDIDSYDICRIHAHMRVFDWMQPPNRNKGSQGTGTGFMLDALPSTPQQAYIVTAYHVVANSVQIRVNFSTITSEYIEAKLIGCNVDMDVAIIIVDDPTFISLMRQHHDTFGLQTGDSDDIRPNATVSAHGFALGGTQVQTTKGVVSARVDAPSRLQTDVAVNPGNSGGPLLDVNNKVIGIVTSGRPDAQGINFVAPITESCVIFKRILKEYHATGRVVYDRMPNLNCSFTKSNRVLLDSIHGCTGGVYTTSVHPSLLYPQTASDALENIRKNRERLDVSAALAQSRDLIEANPEVLRSVEELLAESSDFKYVMTHVRWSMFISSRLSMSRQLREAVVQLLQNDMLQEGDMVSAMIVGDKEYDIDMQMTAKFDFWRNRVGFRAIFDRMSCTESNTVRFKFFRGDAHLVAKVPLAPIRNAYRKMYADADAVSYLVMAGVFVMPLLHNHVALLRGDSLDTLLTRPDSRHLSLLIVTHILPESPFNECESIGVGDVLVSINDQTTVTIEEAAHLWHAACTANTGVVTLKMRDGSLATASREQIRAANERIVAEYKSSEYVGLHTVTSEARSLPPASPRSPHAITPTARATGQTPPPTLAVPVDDFGNHIAEDKSLSDEPDSDDDASTVYQGRSDDDEEDNEHATSRDENEPFTADRDLSESSSVSDSASSSSLSTIVDPQE